MERDKQVLWERDGAVVVLTLNRPEKLNAFSTALRDDFVEALAQIEADDSVRAVVITGAGRAFSAGGDVDLQAARIAGTMPPPDEAAHDIVPPFRGGIAIRLRKLRKLVLGAVNGAAAGGGFSLAMACDLRIASERARFVCGFSSRGLVPDMGLTHTLPQLVGTARALEIIFAQGSIDAREAQQMGLVNKVVPHSELMNEARQVAATLAAAPPIAMAFTKEAVYAAMHRDLQASLHYEILAQGICHKTEDHQEGVNAFLEKRAPKFKGR